MFSVHSQALYMYAFKRKPHNHMFVQSERNWNKQNHVNFLISFLHSFSKVTEARHEKTCYDIRRWSACTRSFIVRCVDSILIIISTLKKSRLLLASVAEQGCSSLIWSEKSEDRFSQHMAQLRVIMTIQRSYRGPSAQFWFLIAFLRIFHHIS